MTDEPQDQTVEIHIDVPDDMEYGIFANAFRVLAEPPNVTLEFSRVIVAEKRAKVVTRILVRPEFLRSVRDRLNQVLAQMEANAVERANAVETAPEAPPSESPELTANEHGLIITVDGQSRLLYKTPKDEN